MRKIKTYIFAGGIIVASIFIIACSKKDAEPASRFDSAKDHIMTDLYIIDGSSSSSCSPEYWHLPCQGSSTDCCFRIRSAEPPYVYRFECRTCPGKGHQNCFFAGIDLSTAQQAFDHLSIVRHMKTSIDTLGTNILNTLDVSETLAFVDDEIPSGWEDETVMYELRFHNSLGVVYSTEEYYYIPVYVPVEEE